MGTLTDRELHSLQRKTFRYFWAETNPDNGLIPDNTQGDVPASIAGVGMALAAYPVGVERGFVSRRAAVARAAATLRFFNETHDIAIADVELHVSAKQSVLALDHRRTLDDPNIRQHRERHLLRRRVT